MVNSKKHIFQIGTFNVRGLTEEYKQVQLTQDMANYKLDICCLQETKIVNNEDINIQGYRLINIQSDCRHYGNGFMVSPKWKDNIVKYWKVSDRICVIQLQLNQKDEYCIESNEQNESNINIRIKKVKQRQLLTIINVYAPTTSRVRNDPTELCEMYTDIGNLITDVKNKNTSLLLLCGDFNAKIGKSTNNESCVGKYSRGIRNNSGQSLIDFCTIQQLFICNSSFKHPARHMTTWQNTREINNSIVNIYNQIDYIICPTSKKHILRDARSYSNTLVSSDHRLVVSRMEIEFYKLYKPNKAKSSKKYNCSLLNSNIQVREDYKKQLQEKISQHENERTEWKNIQSEIKETAEAVIGFTKTHNNNRPENEEIDILSKQQKNLRIKISNCQDTRKAKEMKTERNMILHQIKTKLTELKEQNLNEKVKEIDEQKDSAKMFKAVNMLSRKRFENPYVHDEKGRHVTNPDEIYKILKTHFQTQFNNVAIEKLNPFIGNPRKLDAPITKDEVSKSVKNLNNNRSAGYDKISAELIKHGPEVLHDSIQTVLNQSLEEHEEIDIGTGILVALPKPGKSKGPVKNLRPVILLPILRKILSNIVLNRIKPKVDQYLSESQSAYRQFRSTSDIVWAHRWIAARIQIYREKIFITGIDMSSAFDTIKRGKLLEIISTFLNDDEVRMIRLLLANTSLEIKAENANTEPFESNIGSPQGDGLSGTLFNIYFEYALKKVRSFLTSDQIMDEHAYHKQQEPTLPNEAIYADDADFISDDINQQEKLKLNVKDILLEENLKVNETKTEETVLERKSKVKFKCRQTDGINLTVVKQDYEEKWRTVKKLGSLIGDSEDILRRKQLSIVSLNNLNNIWIRKDHIKQSLRIQLYKSLIKPILMYNSGTWGLSKKDEDNLDAFHRQQLRRVLNVKYPAHIGNAEVYKQTGEEVITLEILKNRWKLFGHVLRSNPRTPAQKAMNHYFEPSRAKKFRGKPRVTLPTLINSDIIKTIQNGTFHRNYGVEKLKSMDDLQKLRTLAHNRNIWQMLVREVYVAAKAEKNY